MSLSDSAMSEVQRFYDGKCLLVTGITGFVGKFLLEKILRSCSPARVYVLIRVKRGQTSEQRLRLFLQNEPVFQFHPQDAEKLKRVIAIEGDIVNPSVCVHKEDLQQILSRVQVVIHSAATVRFNEPFE